MDFDILAALEDRSIEVETLADKDRMQIEYICINDIVPAKNNSNFYATDEITTLKESIRVEGVKQNLIVKKKNNEAIRLFFIYTATFSFRDFMIIPI